MFDSKESLSTAAECVKVAKEHCQQLTEIGLDLTFTLQSLLVKDIKAALQSYKDIIIEATKHRNSEEMWRRMNLMTPEALAKLKVDLNYFCFVSWFLWFLTQCFLFFNCWLVFNQEPPKLSNRKQTFDNLVLICLNDSTVEIFPLWTFKAPFYIILYFGGFACLIML